MRRLAFAFVLVACAASAAADGGRVRLRQDAGPFAITVFTAPEPLTAGPADVSILVQDRGSREVLLDARVEIALRPPGGGKPRVFTASRGENRLLKAASVELEAPGEWGLAVSIRRGGARERVGCGIGVGPARPRLSSIWPFLAAPPLAAALFALRRRLGARRRGRG